MLPAVPPATPAAGDLPLDVAGGLPGVVVDDGFLDAMLGDLSRNGSVFSITSAFEETTRALSPTSPTTQVPVEPLTIFVAGKHERASRTMKATAAELLTMETGQLVALQKDVERGAKLKAAELLAAGDKARSEETEAAQRELMRAWRQCRRRHKGTGYTKTYNKKHRVKGVATPKAATAKIAQLLQIISKQAETIKVQQTALAAARQTVRDLQQEQVTGENEASLQNLLADIE